MTHHCAWWQRWPFTLIDHDNWAEDIPLWFYVLLAFLMFSFVVAPVLALWNSWPVALVGESALFLVTVAFCIVTRKAHELWREDGLCEYCRTWVATHEQIALNGERVKVCDKPRCQDAMISLGYEMENKQ